MIEIGLGHYLSLGSIIFFLGIIGIFLNRKNIIVILMSVELILLAVNINLISFSVFSGDIIGQIFTMLILTVAAAEAAIGLAIIVTKGIYGNYVIFEWINSGNFKSNWSINIDPLSSVMLVVVTFVSSLVHIYSIGYMSNDPHKPRFMSYLSLFTFSMLMLVVSDNFLQLFFGWEGVGLCSYLLIGFWYKKESANNAAIKAFIVNRVGDFGLAVGIFLIFFYFGSINFDEVFSSVSSLSQKNIIFLGVDLNLITLVCIFLFI